MFKSEKYGKTNLIIFLYCLTLLNIMYHKESPVTKLGVSEIEATPFVQETVWNNPQ